MVGSAVVGVSVVAIVVGAVVTVLDLCSRGMCKLASRHAREKSWSTKCIAGDAAAAAYAAGTIRHGLG